MLHVQIQITSEGVLFLPLSFFTLGQYNLIKSNQAALLFELEGGVGRERGYGLCQIRTLSLIASFVGPWRRLEHT